jgi:hypothetical protein
MVLVARQNKSNASMQLVAEESRAGVCCNRESKNAAKPAPFKFGNKLCAGCALKQEQCEDTVSHRRIKNWCML